MANPQHEKSNLSETARFVKPYLDDITAKLRDKGLVTNANEIIATKYNPDDPKVKEFVNACGELEEKITAEAEKKGVESKGLSVIKNYFSKLLKMVRESKELKLNKIKEEVLAEAE